MSDLFKEILREISKNHNKEEKHKQGYRFEKQVTFTIISRISDEKEEEK